MTTSYVCNHILLLLFDILFCCICSRTLKFMYTGKGLLKLYWLHVLNILMILIMLYLWMKIRFDNIFSFPQNSLSLAFATVFFKSYLIICLQVIFFKYAIEDMAARTLRCVAIAYRTCELKSVPTNNEELSRWALPGDNLILLAIVGIKV